VVRISQAVCFCCCANLVLRHCRIVFFLHAFLRVQCCSRSKFWLLQCQSMEVFPLFVGHCRHSALCLLRSCSQRWLFAFQQFWAEVFLLFVACSLRAYVSIGGGIAMFVLRWRRCM
jgi:hypothetical protein